MTSHSESKIKNIIFIVLDTHRADRLGIYGNKRGASPNLDEYARGSAVYDCAIAPAQWTIPSHASMFTGLPPSTHLTTQANSVLDEQFKTFAELLSQSGYETIGFCNNPLVGLINNNLKRGFQTFYNYSGTTPDIPLEFPDSSIFPYIRLWEKFLKGVRKVVDPIQNKFATNHKFLQTAVNPLFVPLWSRFVNFKGNAAHSIRHTSQYLARKASQPGGEPFLMFLNLMETHLPFVPPRKFAHQFAPYLAEDRKATAFIKHFNTLAMHWLIPLKQPFTPVQAGIISDLYDAEVAYQDHLLGELLELLDQPAIRDQSLIVITADHGEMLGEHQFMGHGFGCYRELIQVPLIIHTPAMTAGARISTPVITTRLFHTVLASAGMDMVVSPTGTETSTGLLSLIDPVTGMPVEPGTDGMKVISEAYAPQDAVMMMEKREPELIDPFLTRFTHRAFYMRDVKLYDIEGNSPRLMNHKDAILEQGQPEMTWQAELMEKLMEELHDFVEDSRAGHPQGWTTATADLSDPMIEQRMRDLGYMI